MLPLGKTFFMWKLIYCEGGNPEAIASTAANAGLTAVYFKIANGKYPYNVSADIPAIVAALRDYGISVWGWHYIYLNEPEAEADIAIQRTNQFDLDGYIIDAEGECKNKPTQTVRYMNRLSAGLNVPIVLCSYRYPSLHRELSWRSFLEKCNGVMPQVYWAGSNNPEYQLRRCFQEYNELYSSLNIPPLPMHPVGAAYREFGWQPTVGEILEFMNTAASLQLPGCSFWEWWFARERIPEFWAAISDYNYPTNYLTMRQKLNILWREAETHGWNLLP